jgi:hypothetical protein
LLPAKIAGIESLHAVHILDFDLDLFVVFDAALAEDRVSRAADRLGV